MSARNVPLEKVESDLPFHERSLSPRKSGHQISSANSVCMRCTAGKTEEEIGNHGEKERGFTDQFFCGQAVAPGWILGVFVLFVETN